MAVTYDTSIKNARMTAVRDALNSGSLELQNGTGTALVTFPLAASAGSVTNGVLTLAFASSSATASTTGTVAQAVIKDNGGTARVTGLVEGTDFNIDNPSLVSGQTVNVGTFTITHA